MAGSICRNTTVSRCKVMYLLSGGASQLMESCYRPPARLEAPRLSPHRGISPPEVQASFAAPLHPHGVRRRYLQFQCRSWRIRDACVKLFATTRSWRTDFEGERCLAPSRRTACQRWWWRWQTFSDGPNCGSLVPSTVTPGLLPDAHEVRMQANYQVFVRHCQVCILNIHQQENT